MIVRIGRGHIRPGTWEAFEETYKRALLDTERPPGLQGRWLARDVDDEHGGYTIGIWDDEDALTEWLGSDSFAAAQEQMRPYFVGDFQVHTCDVRVRED